MKKSAILFLLLCVGTRSFAQGTFSGDLQSNVNFFQKDPTIKASGNELYDSKLSGSDAWLSLRYTVGGFTFFARADAFDNSNLKNPLAANSDFGIGAWSISKDVENLSITVGSIYDQIGSGILFRSYEDRGLLIDNALVGLELKYKLAPNIILKGFTGQQKDNRKVVTNTRYAPVIKGFNAEGDFSAGKIHLIPGVGVLNRTIDNQSMTDIASAINAQQLDTRFNPMYNMYAFAAYNTLTYKNFTWYAEGDYKTHEAILDTRPFSSTYRSLIDKPGNVEYTTLSYGRKGLAINFAGKRTETFVMRTSPNQTLLDGMMNWQPVVAVMRPQRLMSRYTPASQDMSEMAGSLNMVISPSDNTNYTLTGTYINTLDGKALYREAYGEVYTQKYKSWVLEGGVQYLEYNTPIYMVRPNGKYLYGITPFAEITRKFTDTRSLRLEMQYMYTKQDYGSWAFALLEYDVAPKWSVSVSDMYNVVPNNTPGNIDYPNVKVPGNHYPSIFCAYTKGANRFTLAYVKQVDGINCTGGVCRYEPAFSGVKATLASSF